MERVKVSIIIPIFNAEKFLNRSISSVMNQTYNNIEIILVNDGSTDNSQKLCEKFLKEDKRIQLINCENNGVSFARNLGLERSTGEYIFFLDSDDYIAQKTIEIMVKKANENDADIVKINHFNTYPNGKEKINNLDLVLKEKLKKKELMVIDSKIREYLYANTYLLNTVWGELIKKNLVEGILFDKEVTYGEDLLFNFKVIQNSKKMIFLKEAYYHYYINRYGINQNYDFNILCKKIQNLNYVYGEIIKQCNEKEEISYKYIKEVIDNLKKIFLTQTQLTTKKQLIIKEIENPLFKTSCENVNLSRISKKDKLFINMIKKGKYNLFIFYASIFYRNIWIIKNTLIGEKNGENRIKRKDKIL